MSKSTPNNASAGFTVTELVVVMGIVAIVAAIGIPSFKYVTASNRIASEINGLLGDMQFARSQAVKEGQSVTVCASSNSTAANPTCSGSNAWENGWIVFLDANGNKQVDAGEQVIRTQPPFNGTDTFVASTAAFSATTFNRMGYAPTGLATNITINLHNSTNVTAWTRCLQITPIGTPTTEKFGAGTPPCS
ncbi:MAG: GspH/FimT family pseudopilin [Steroidobacteraceae bacterium]